MNPIVRGAAILGISATVLAAAWQAQETFSQSSRMPPTADDTGPSFSLPRAEDEPLSVQIPPRHAVGYPSAYLGSLELIEDLPEALRAEIARDPQGFNARSQQLVNEIGLSGSVTAKDVRRYRQSQTAQARAAKLAGYLALDLNGDGNLTADEIDYAAWNANVDRRTEIRALAAAADSNSDGTISYQELVAAIDRELIDRNASAAGLPFDPMLFDMNGDGKVVHDELRMMGYLIAEEVNLSAWCDLPPPPPEAELIVFGTGGGYSLSHITLRGTHTLAEVATLVIEPGDTPLYIIAATAEPLIWKVAGAVERVARLVVLPYTPSGLPRNRLTERPSGSQMTGAAVAGLPAEAVSFTAPGGCFLPFRQTTDRQAIRALIRVTRLLGREIDHFLAFKNIETLSLPSGTMRTRRPVGYLGIRFVNPNARMATVGDPSKRRRPPQRGSPEAAPRPMPRPLPWPQRALVKLSPEDLVRRYPGGAIYLDPARLVAPGPVAEPEQILGGIRVPPTVAELVAQGILRQLPSRAFVLEEPIERFPAGLEEANEVTFVIPEDVPIPRGDPGNATVILQETGLCVHGPRCVR